MTATCTPRIHERFRKEWLEILDTRELYSFHFNHSPHGVQHLFLGLFFPLQQQCGQSNLNIQ
jgi:hypothetical protein